MNEIEISDVDRFVEGMASMLTAAVEAARPEIEAARATRGEPAAVDVVRRVLSEKIEMVFEDAMRALVQELTAGAPKVQ